LEAETARRISAPDYSFIGLRHAEDWIISAVLSEGFPIARGFSARGDPMEIIEAVLPGGSSFDGSENGIGAVIYIADTDYGTGLFTGSLKNRASTPFIPSMQSVMTDDETRRFYYLRSSFVNDDGVTAQREELLAVTLDKHTLDVSAARIFSRRIINPY